MKGVLLIEHPKTGDTYYVGDLDAGKALIQRDRFVYEGETGDHFWVVLCDDLVDVDTNPIDAPSVAEWGAGASLDEAWRYALGAAFGPLDSEFDEVALRKALAPRSDLG